MTDVNESSGQSNSGLTTDQPPSPAHSNSSQHALQLQQQKLLHQQQQQLLQQQQQNQLLQQQQMLQQQQQNQQAFGQQGLMGQVSGLGGQYGQQFSQAQLQANMMGQQSFAGGVAGLAGQLPQLSEAMATGANSIQANGMPPKPNSQHPSKSSFVGQIPAGNRQQHDPRTSGSSAASIPAMPGFGMVGQVPEHAMNRPMVGQLPQSMYQQPASFGFQQQLASQQLNFPLASAGMPSNGQFGFGQPFNMYSNGMNRSGPMIPGSHDGSVQGSVYNFPDSASVMSRGSAAQPTAAPPVVSLASLSSQQKVGWISPVIPPCTYCCALISTPANLRILP